MKGHFVAWMDGVEREGSAPVQGGRDITAWAFTLEC